MASGGRSYKGNNPLKNNPWLLTNFDDESNIFLFINPTTVANQFGMEHFPYSILAVVAFWPSDKDVGQAIF